jgi:hypothetical protein
MLAAEALIAKPRIARLSSFANASPHLIDSLGLRSLSVQHPDWRTGYGGQNILLISAWPEREGPALQPPRFGGLHVR